MISPMNAAKAEYKMKVDLASIVRKAGGRLFGGYPRDFVLHESNAKAFYDTPNVDVSKYNDPTYLPETKERLTIPSDIDAFISSENIDRLTKKIVDFGYTIWKSKSSHLGYIMNDSQRLLNVKHEKLTIVPAVPQVLKSLFPKIEVTIDLVHIDNFTPDLMVLDFECNGLMIESAGHFSLHPSLLSSYANPMTYTNKVNQIIKDILEKKAVKVNDTFPYRVDKMLQKGWTIQGHFMEVKKYNSEDTEYCAICHDSFTENVASTGELAVKNKCCQGHMHMKCMKKLVKENYDTCCYCCKELNIEDDILGV